jgi:hypothetical protein
MAVCAPRRARFFFIEPAGHFNYDTAFAGYFSSSDWAIMTPPNFDPKKCQACAVNATHTEEEHNRYLELWCDEHLQWCGDHTQRTLKIRLEETKRELDELGAIQEKLRTQREKVEQELEVEKETRKAIIAKDE